MATATRTQHGGKTQRGTKGQRGTGPRHRKRQSLRPEGRHRASLDFTGRWIVPVGLAVAILAAVGVLLVLADALI